MFAWQKINPFNLKIALWQQNSKIQNWKRWSPDTSTTLWKILTITLCMIKFNIFYLSYFTILP
jgi:hypothetical protein